MGKILCFGEPLVRISPQDFSKVSNTCRAQLYYGGSEVNIARTLAGFGTDSKLLTALPDNPLGDSFLQFLKESNIDTSGILRLGERIGIYYLENGIGCRQSQVSYDRSHTSIRELTPDNIDTSKIFQDVSHFHFSGITLALGQNAQDCLNALLKTAKELGISVSFDLNFRSKLITLNEAKHLFSHFAHYADYCFGIEPLMVNDEDFGLFNRQSASQEHLVERMHALRERFGFKAIFHTIRTTDELGQNHYQAFSYDGDLTISQALKTRVLQRVGSGDAFIAGALYQLTQEKDMKTLLDFAVAAATLKCTLEGDSLFEKPQAVQQILASSYDIIR